MAKDWYEHRDELDPEQVFRMQDGSIVKLDRRVPGDGTDWYVADWIAGRPDVPGYERGHFSFEDSRIHPGELTERLPDDFAA